MTGHAGGAAQAGPPPSASAARTAETTTPPETEVTTEGGGGDDLRTDLDLTRPPKPGSAAVPSHPFPAAEPAPPRTAEQILLDEPLWRITKTAPDGHDTETWLVGNDERDEAAARALCFTSDYPGWAVRVEPVT